MKRPLCASNTLYVSGLLISLWIILTKSGSCVDNSDDLNRFRSLKKSEQKEIGLLAEI
jgi:hypothetical protein